MYYAQDTKEFPMTKEESTVKTEFSFKERLVLTLLLSIIAPSMFFIVGAIDVYANNISEFEFVLGDFILWGVIYCVFWTAVLIGILLPLKGAWFDYTYSVIFWLSFGMFLQGNYLNFGLNSLTSDGAADVSWLNLILNSAIWLAIGFGIIFSVKVFIHRFRNLIRTVAVITLVTVIGMNGLSLLTTVLTTDIFISHEDRVSSSDGKLPSVLSYKNIRTLGEDSNIVYFVIDRFDYHYYEQALRECPEVFDELDGFTCYQDGLSLYPRTYPSVAYMITGVEHDFTRERAEYFKHAYESSDFLDTLRDNGYSINVYTDKYYSYESADCTNSDNEAAVYPEYTVKNSGLLGMRLALVAMYRYFPFIAKPVITLSTASFTEHVIRDSEYPRYTTDMRDLYLSLTEDELEISTDKNFSFIHFSGTHPPYLYDENFNEAVVETPMSALKQSFKIINRYISEMKRLGVYDDATIVITGDHANIGLNNVLPLAPQTVPIFFKSAGESEGDFVKSDAPVAHENVIPAILKSVGLAADGMPKALGDISAGDDVVRKYYYQCLDTQNTSSYTQFEYEIIGSARDFKSWTIKKQYSVGDIYE